MNRIVNEPSNKQTALIELPHKVCEYACISVGLEDMYEKKTGVRLPDNVIKNLSMLGFMYISQKRSPVPRMVFWGNNTGKPQHSFLGDVIGYQWEFDEGRSFESALTSVKEHVDKGEPVILGLLDMYHLPYFTKFYHRIRIPEHYVLMVGYDLEKGVIYATDNSLPGVQTIPLTDLREAWNVNTPGRGKRNTYTVVSFDSDPADLETIVRRGLKKRANWMFEPPTGFMGMPGLRRFAKEFNRWQSELTQSELKKSLEHLCMFSCSDVPMPPDRLMQQKEYRFLYQAARDKYSDMIRKYAVELNEPAWEQAGEYLSQSGIQIGMMIDRVVDALLGDQSALSEAGKILPKIVELEEKAWSVLR